MMVMAQGETFWNNQVGYCLGVSQIEITNLLKYSIYFAPLARRGEEKKLRFLERDIRVYTWHIMIQYLILKLWEKVPKPGIYGH